VLLLREPGPEPVPRRSDRGWRCAWLVRGG